MCMLTESLADLNRISQGGLPRRHTYYGMWRETIGILSEDLLARRKMKTKRIISDSGSWDSKAPTATAHREIFVLIFFCFVRGMCIRAWAHACACVCVCTLVCIYVCTQCEYRDQKTTWRNWCPPSTAQVVRLGYRSSDLATVPTEPSHSLCLSQSQTQGHLFTAGETENYCSHAGNQTREFSPHCTIPWRMPKGPDMLPTSRLAQPCSITTARRRRWPECPSAGKWGVKLRRICTTKL